MKGYDYANGRAFGADFSNVKEGAKLAVICGPEDTVRLMELFRWDKDTVDECTNIDETVRYTNYDGYDFISLIYAESGTDTLKQQEVNLFFSRDYIVLVAPDERGAKLTKLCDAFEKAIHTSATRSQAPLVYLFYFIFDRLAVDYSETLEKLEDEMEALSEAIERSPEEEQSGEIAKLRKTAYTYMKILRALSYIGGQIVIDDNNIFDRNQLRYFRSIETRLLKLYDFADNLYDLSNQLLNTYDSKFSAKMNESINKLTVLTLFVGPVTVITGIYGMNFTNMPELKWYYGYPAVILLIIIICAIIYFILKKKKML
jgi:magnesium transporter